MNKRAAALQAFLTSAGSRATPPDCWDLGRGAVRARATAKPPLPGPKGPAAERAKPVLRVVGSDEPKDVFELIATALENFGDRIDALAERVLKLEQKG